MRTITIAGSATFWEKSLEYKHKLESNGYKVLAYVIHEDGSQTWKELHEQFFTKLIKSDDIYVLNLDKKGIKGYIGYETFAELSYMVIRKVFYNEDVNIYLHQWPDKQCGCYDEIMEMKQNGWVSLLSA